MEPIDCLIPARELREIISADTARPSYHLACPEGNGYPFDPNCAFCAGGRIHLMFLYSPEGVGYSYGHLSSADLLHWRRHPDAIVPDEKERGIYSGGAFVDRDGTAIAAYWAIEKEKLHDGKNGIHIAISRDAENGYDTWVKDPENAVKADGAGFFHLTDESGNVRHVACADPSNIWKKGDYYYLQAGNLPVLDYYGRNGGDPYYRGDYTELFRSRDLRHWEYLHKFYEDRPGDDPTDDSEDDMCPVFLPLPSSREGGAPTDHYLQLFISHNRGCQYYIGNYDTENDRFLPVLHGRMSWKDPAFFAPEAVTLPDGRVVMWAWINDRRQNEVERFGWSGVYGVPRTLWYASDGTLGISPLCELEKLRERPIPLSACRSDCCEIRVSYRPSEVSLNVLESDDRSEYVTVSYSAARGELSLDTSHCGSEGRRIREVAPLVLREGESLDLTVFVDRSVVEVFANDRQAISRRAFRDRNGKNIRFLSGDLIEESLEIWEMDATNFD